MIRINICIENGGRIEFIKHESMFFPTVERERLIVLDDSGRNEYLYSQIVAVSCWLRPAFKESFT